MGRRSINQQLKKKKKTAPELRINLAQDWARNWMQDQNEVLRSMENAQNWEDIESGLSQLRAITEKRFSALQEVLLNLADSPTKNDV